MDPTVKQSIANTVISTVAAAVNVIQTKHKEEMLAFQEMIRKFLLFRDSSASTSLPNPNTSSKALLLANLQSKATDKWN